MKKIYILFSLFFLVLRVHAQCPGPAQRTALLNLQKANIVESSRAGQIPLTDACGNLRYGQYTEIDLVPITYTPSPTGNTQNYSEFVTTLSGDIWYLDWQGRGIKLWDNSGGGGANDYDWLTISDNTIPDNIVDSIYTGKYASVNMRRVWPNAQLLVGDSTGTNGASGIVAGDRSARWGFVRMLDSTWSSIGQEGTNNAIRLGPGTTAFKISVAAGPSPSQATAPFRDVASFRTDSLIRFNDYPNTRNDTATAVNFFYSDAQGYLKSGPVSEIAGIDSTYWANVFSFGAVGNGTDATIAFQSAIATGKPVYVPKGRYVISDTLFLQKDQSLFGIGDGSVLQINGGGIVFFVKTSGISISNLRIVGKSGSGIFQTAIRIDDPVTSTNSQLNRIENVTIDSILFHGIRLESSWVGYKGSIISGCKFTNCATGLYINSRGEYNTITSNIFTANTTAISLTGGNNNISNCNVSGNTKGFTIVAGTNELHGIISGCQINHNTQYGISATGTTLEQRVLNCQMYYSDLEFSNSDNFKFVGCTFSTDTLRFQSGSDNNYFTECEFVAGIVKSITSSSVYFINNTNKTGSGQYGEFPTTTGQYILDVASGQHSWQLNTGGTTYTADQGITKTATDVFQFGGNHIGASAISGNRKFNLSDTTLVFGDANDSTLLQIRGGYNQVSVGGAPGSALSKLSSKATASRHALSLHKPDNSVFFQGASDGKCKFSDFIFAPYFVASDQYSTGFPTTHSATSSGMTFSAGTDGNAFYFTSPIPWSAISGDRSLIKIGNTVNPTSSSATMTQLRIVPTYNQTGTANGDMTGIEYNPTITALAGVNYAAKFRSGRVTINTLLGNGTAKLQIGASSGAAGDGPVKLTPGTLLTTPEPGALEYSGTEFTATTTTGTRENLARVLKATATLDFPATTGPLPETLTVTVPGAVLGDMAQVAPVTGWPTGSWLLTAIVTGVNQVTVQATNLSGVSVDLSSQNYNIVVTKY